MKQFSMLASLIGGFSALGGFWIAYAYDLPVGPTDIALLGCIYAIAFGLKKATGLLRRSV
jgi:ABC-type Mn2+/Zn2+ transport system permease subunit